MKVSQLAEAFSRTGIVGLGESSHGTHEFFDFKSKLFRRLVENQGFNTLLFEDSQEACSLANDYISGKDIDPESACGKLYSVWRTEELKQLLIWLKDHQSLFRVEFVGFDIDQAGCGDLSLRDELMAENIRAHCAANPDTRAVVWAHNSHIQTVGSNDQPRPMGYFLKQSLGRQYQAMALLFGRGSVSATRLKAGQAPGQDRSLSPIKVGPPPGDLAEFAFDKLTDKPVFMTRDMIRKMAPPNRVRSIGWGLIPEQISEAVEDSDLKRGFDLVAYFPKGTASHPLPS